MKMNDIALYQHKSLVPVALSNDTLDAYQQQVSAIRVLSAEQERELAIDLRDNANLEAARELIFSHLRFVAHIARGYKGYGLPLADVIQEGNIGLMKAVKRFDPEVGVRLVSFAVHWIRAEIHEYILKNWRIVKVATTKAQRKLFFKLRSSKKRLGWMNQAEVETIAGDLGVDAKTVVEMESRLSGHDMSYDLPEGSDDDAPIYSPAQYLAAPGLDPAELAEKDDSGSQNAETLMVAMKDLDGRSQDILTRRWLTDDKATLHELAAEYEVSAERIRQLEANAIKKLRGAFAL
jgi:RNA polymerase sigma-32 factor